MTTASIFLTAEWRKLIMANYPVEASCLLPFLPAHTELDDWQGQHYVSLVGFAFRKVRIKGLRVPFHTDFPEVNLRFYVRYKDGISWKRGVVFISEIVPKPAIAWVANTLFKEHYISLPMRDQEKVTGDVLQLSYSWRWQGRWHELSVEADAMPVPLQAGSKEEFITEHFWGYAGIDQHRTGEYQVAHPRWNIHTVRQHHIDCDFGGLYGAAFIGLAQQQPASVFLAKGSPIQVYQKKIITA